MRHKLVVYKNQTYQAIYEDATHYTLKLPYIKNSKEFRVRKNHCVDYPRTYTEIVNRWIENPDPLEGWTPHLYVLETLDRMVSPTFLLAPKDKGFYTAIWQGKDEVKVSFLLFWPDHPLCPRAKERFNTFDLQTLSWIKMEDLILCPEFQNIRFMPFNPGIGFSYLLHLVESDVLTRKEFNERT